jgi:universal stress protein A
MATWRPSVLCPVDFSDASRVALRYAVAIASHFGATVTLVTVNDPILAETADLKLGADWLSKQCQAELKSEVAKTVGARGLENVEIRYEVRTGAPAREILRLASERHCDLIVMSSRGLSGVRRLFFGTTTERVLRETSVPVLVTPATAHIPATLETMAAEIRRVLVPVDLVSSPTHQVRVASGITVALGTPLLLLHVLEPLRAPVPVQMPLPNVDVERRTQADQALAELAAQIGHGARVEALTAFGDSAEEIAKIAADRQVGLIVMGLHASPVTGARMGSVTYRVLCLAHPLVLALPPAPAGAHPV